MAWLLWGARGWSLAAEYGVHATVRLQAVGPGCRGPVMGAVLGETVGANDDLWLGTLLHRTVADGQ